MSSTPQRSPRGTRRRVGAWAAQHLQCAVGSLGALCRSPVASALTAAVIGVALALPLSAYLVVHSVSKVSERFSSTSDISVFLKPDVDDTAAQALAERLAADPAIAQARVIGKSEGLAEFRRALGVISATGLLGEDNPLPAVVVVRPRSLQDPALGDLIKVLGRLPLAEFVQFDRQWLSRLEAILEVVHRVLFLAATLLGSGVILVIGNTLRMSIETRRSEIEIAKLFGASDAFVRRPFLYHGLFYGLSGALVGCVLIFLAAVFLDGPLTRLAAEYAGELDFPGPGPRHVAVLLASGGALGLLGAWLSVGRHLRAVEPR